MDYKKEICRRDRKIEDLKNTVSALKEEIKAYKEILDCAAANIVMLVKESGGVRKISKKDVSEALGKYKLTAKRSGDDSYLIEVIGENAS